MLKPFLDLIPDVNQSCEPINPNGLAGRAIRLFRVGKVCKGKQGHPGAVMGRRFFATSLKKTRWAKGFSLSPVTQVIVCQHVAFKKYPAKSNVYDRLFSFEHLSSAVFHHRKYRNFLTATAYYADSNYGETFSFRDFLASACRFLSI
jgi:hypothetical protein